MTMIARKKSKAAIDDGGKPKRCETKECSNFISGKGRRCKEHAPRTLLALDFNNLCKYLITNDYRLVCKLPLN